MHVLDAIFTRRSIRKFTGEVINDEELMTLLNAGFASPTASNKQSWEFIVIKDQLVLNKIVEIHPYAQMLPEAGCGIMVCGNLNRQEREGFLVEDASAAIQNILLAAHGIGLGAVWCGLYPEEEINNLMKELLGIPNNVLPIGLVSVGYKAEERDPVNRFDSSKVHFNKWENHQF